MWTGVATGYRSSDMHEGNGFIAGIDRLGLRRRVRDGAWAVRMSAHTNPTILEICE